VILGLGAYSFDIVEPYVNQTAKDASERKLRAILAKLDPPQHGHSPSADQSKASLCLLGIPSLRLSFFRRTLGPEPRRGFYSPRHT